MTGFGTAEGDIPGARVAIEIRSVNHRYFNASIKLPPALARCESDVRDALRARITRGHVSLSARVERREAEGIIDEAAFGHAVEVLRRLQERYVLGGTVDVATVLRVPGIVAAPPEDLPPESTGAVVKVVDAALDALMRTRAAEGAKLATIVAERLDLVDAAIARLGARAPVRIDAHRERLWTAVQELAGGVAVDPQRLAQEIAILAERLDVGEELDRFRLHTGAFRTALRATDGDPVGKRLGFLLQEMLREANTTGSKSNDAVMQHDVLIVKEELERIREQVENLE